MQGLRLSLRESHSWKSDSTSATRSTMSLHHSKPYARLGIPITSASLSFSASVRLWSDWHPPGKVLPRLSHSILAALTLSILARMVASKLAFIEQVIGLPHCHAAGVAGGISLIVTTSFSNEEAIFILCHGHCHVIACRCLQGCTAVLAPNLTFFSTKCVAGFHLSSAAWHVSLLEQDSDDLWLSSVVLLVPVLSL